MGAYFLLDLADVCRRTGRHVIEVDDWRTRARGSGGYNPGLPNHVMCHHTASGPESDGWDDVNYCCYGDEDAPLCNLYLARDGTIYVCAAGATNTNGSGSDPCGLIGDDAMNSSAIGIEAGNNGVGEPWSTPQQDAYVALCDALCNAYGIGVVQIHGHAEWTSRKIDPAGPSRYAWDASTWDMDEYREDVALGTTPPPPTPGGLVFTILDITGTDVTFGGNMDSHGIVAQVTWLGYDRWVACVNLGAPTVEAAPTDLLNCDLLGPIPPGFRADQFANVIN